MKRIFLYCLLVLGLFLGSAQAAIHDRILDRAYFEDKTNLLSLDQAKKQAFIPFKSMFTQGYSHSTFWLRLKIAPDVKHDQLVLKVQPTYLDEIELFDPAATDRTARIQGDRHPYANNERRAFTYDFLIPASQQERYVWLRLKTTSTNLMQVMVVSEAEALSMDRQLDMATSAIFASLFIFMLWALMHWWATKERLVGIFIIRQLFGIGFFAAYVGYFRILLAGILSPAVLDGLTSFLVISSTATAMWFHGEFFKEYLIHPKLQAVFKIAIALFPLEVLLFAMGKLSTGLLINMTVVMLLPPFMFMISLVGIPWYKLRGRVHLLPKTYLVVAHGLYLFIGLLATLPSLAIASGGILSPHAVIFYTLVSAIVVVFMIYYRSKRLEEKRAVDFALHAQNASNERTKREEQSRFFEMLTHEFKTSLAVLKMAFGSIDLGAKESRYANHAVDSMNDVIERCLQLQSLNDGQVQVALDDINLCDLIGSVAKSARSSERIQLDCANVLMVKSDEKLLKVMLSNLIDNALKYSDPETFVNVRVESTSDEVKVTVSNKVGHAGMPDQARIFDKYYRSERAHKQIGSGLGLYLTSQFANMLGMKLNYVPKPELVEFELCLKRSI